MVSMWSALVLPLVLSLAGSVLYQHWAHPFEAVPYSLKPPAPLADNSLLQSADLFRSPLLSAPETVAVHPVDSSLWTGCYTGSIVRVVPDSADSGFEARLVTHTGWAALNGSAAVNLTAVCPSTINPWLCGRPLGMVFRSADELLIADGYHGLLSYTLSSGVWQSLWNDSLRDANSVTLDSSSGLAYFTSASGLYRNHEVLYECTAGLCRGSVWQFDFRTREARLLHDGLCFANGVLVHRRQLIVAETTAGRIIALDLDQPQRSPVVVADSDRLPCLPDNLHFDPAADLYWMGCGAPIRAPNKLDVYNVMGAFPRLRQLLVYTLPHSVIASLAAAQAMVVRVRVVNDSWHEVSDVLMDPDGSRLHTTTGATWRAADNKLWFSTFKPVSHNAQYTAVFNDYMSSLPYPPPPSADARVSG